MPGELETFYLSSVFRWCEACSTDKKQVAALAGEALCFRCKQMKVWKRDASTVSPQDFEMPDLAKLLGRTVELQGQHNQEAARMNEQKKPETHEDAPPGNEAPREGNTPVGTESETAGDTTSPTAADDYPNEPSGEPV